MTEVLDDAVSMRPRNYNPTRSLRARKRISILPIAWLLSIFCSMFLRFPIYFLPILLAYLLLVVGNETERHLLDAPQSGKIHVVRSETACSWQCHHATINHCLAYHNGLSESAREAVEPAYFGLTALLRSSGNYRAANLLFLGLLWPLLLSIGMMRCLRLTKNTWTRPLTLLSWMTLVTALVLCAGTFRENNSYEYLTDFILTLSRWSGLSYYDVNAIVFIVIWPLITLITLAVWPILEIVKRSASKLEC